MDSSRVEPDPVELGIPEPPEISGLNLSPFEESVSSIDDDI
jgi:hypothetical protein